jgi:hypothetical protein
MYLLVILTVRQFGIVEPQPVIIYLASTWFGYVEPFEKTCGFHGRRIALCSALSNLLKQIFLCYLQFGFAEPIPLRKGANICNITNNLPRPKCSKDTG